MKWLLHVFALLAPLHGFAVVVPIHSITHMELNLEEEKQVLVVFDIDDTLTILDEPAFQGPNFKVHHSSVFSSIMDPLSDIEKQLAFTIPLFTSSGDLIEIESPAFIADLHRNRIKTIALTAAPAGEIEGASLQDRRIAELNRVGIDFSPSFPDVGEIVFTDFNLPIVGTYPLYKKGVILTNNTHKGEVLVRFLKTIEWTPDEILFVDDRMSNIHDVESALKHFYPEITFKGFHFKTERVGYKQTDADNFCRKWIEMVEMSKEILAKDIK
ncbi:MAG: DUF2608 domain-containing protein [Verrucomicrobia bacterium]|nr:DUF2608 domain-containing protein [Verrucomicrobiota bacterium]